MISLKKKRMEVRVKMKVEQGANSLKVSLHKLGKARLVASQLRVSRVMSLRKMTQMKFSGKKKRRKSKTAKK